VSLVEDGFHIEQLKATYNNNDLHRIFRPLLLIDSFTIFGVHGKHYCSVFELMGPNLLDVIQHYEYKDVRMPVQLVKKITRDVLIGLIYMHEYVHMIHTDLKPENIIIKLTP
jgi:serine/threonine protein kinase